MMRADKLFPQTFCQEMRHPLRHPSRADENQRAAVRLNQLDQLLDDFGPLLVHADRAERAGGDLDLQIEFPRMSDVDNGNRVGPLAGVGHFPACPREEFGDPLQRALRGGETDPLQPTPTQRFQPLERKGQMRAPLVPHQGVNFIDDHRFRRRERGPSPLGSQQQIQRFRRRHQNMRRLADQFRPFRGGGVTGPQTDTDRNIGLDRRGDVVEKCSMWELPVRLGLVVFPRFRGIVPSLKPLFDKGRDLPQRLFEILVHVVRQGAERRDVDDRNPVVQFTREAPLQEPVDAGEESGERFSASGGGGDQGVPPGGDFRPPLLLGFGGSGEAGAKPALDERMKTEK